MTFLCKICNIYVSSEEILRFHEAGKKHQRLASTLERKVSEAERSIFVKGFPVGTNSETMKQYFSKYGNINQVFVDNEKGYFAIVDFSSRDTAKKVIQMNGKLFMNHKKLKISPRNIKNQKPSKQNDFKNICDNIETDIINEDDLFKVLHQTESIDDQIESLQNNIALSHEEIEKRVQMQRQINGVIQKYIPGSSVEIFGSSINGFGVKGADVDLFLDLKLDNSLAVPLTSSTAALPFVKDIKALKIENNQICIDSLKNARPYIKLRFISRILVSTGIADKNLVLIPSTRCPVIRFIHKEFSLKTDFSLGSGLAVQNTNLQRILVNNEPRLKPLMYTIRHWAKVKSVAGNMNNGPKLSNYSLTLMLITYLQNTDPPVFPSIESIMKFDSCNSLKIDGWNCSLPSIDYKWMISSNKSSLTNLLIGFFNFYSTKDFNQLVICPRTGSLTPTPDFQQHISNQEYDDKFTMGFLNIQDPFLLSHNTSANVNEKSQLHMMQMFGEATLKSNLFSSCDKCLNWGLINLFSNENLLENHSLSPDESDRLLIHFRPSNLVIDSTLSIDEQKRNWIICIFYLFQKIMTEILYFKLDVSHSINVTFPTLKEVLKSFNLSSSLFEFDPEIINIIENTENNSPTRDKNDAFFQSHTSEGCNIYPESSLLNQERFTSSSIISCQESSMKDFARNKNEKLFAEINDVYDDTIPDSKPISDISITPDFIPSETPLDDDVCSLFKARCHTCYRTWWGRKKGKQNLKSDIISDSYELERSISNELIRNVVTSAEAVFSFEANMTLREHLSHVTIEIDCKPLDKNKELNSFRSFLKSYILKLLSKILHKT